MISELVSILVLLISLSAPIKCTDPVQSLQQLQGFLGAYQKQLATTIQMIKENKLDEVAGEKQLNEVKNSLKQVTGFVQNDPGLASIPGMKELGAPLKLLTELTSTLQLDGLIDQLRGMFGLLGQVTKKIQKSAADVGGKALPVG